MERRLLAIDYELLTANPAEQVKVQGGDGAKARVGFSVEDLNRLFKSPIYTEALRPKSAGREAGYWLPLMALFTGCRVEELAQLLVSDIRHEDGLGHFINISDEAPHSHLKNASSKRRVPLHSILLDCGLLEYAETVRHRLFLFPDLKPNPRQKLGGYFSNFFSGYLRKQVGITDRRKVFHSFRHTFKDVCRSIGIEESVHDALTGHTAPSAGRKYGNEQYPLAPLFAAIQDFDVPGLEIDHLFTRPPTRRVPTADCQLVSAYYGIVVVLAQVKRPTQMRPYLFARCRGGE